MKKIDVIGTLSPKILNKAILSELISTGMNVIRLNIVHQDLKWHKEALNLIRSVSADVKIIIDIQGSTLRFQDFKKEIEVNKGDEVVIVDSKKNQNISKLNFYIGHPGFKNDVLLGDKILLSNGKIKTTVVKITKNNVYLLIKNKGIIKSPLHINLFKKDSSMKSLNIKDCNMLTELAMNNKIDFVALSFTKHEKQVEELRDFLIKNKLNIDIIAKIETQSGIDNAEAIIKVSDGVMIARGDLKIETSFKELPSNQKKIIKLSNKLNTYCIVATDLFTSMINSEKPSSRDMLDVKTALKHGVDGLMLSEEVAVGKYPIDVVKTIRQIINN